MEPINSYSVKSQRSLLTMLICTLVFVLASCGGDNSTGPDDDEDTDPPPSEPTFANVQDIFNTSCGGENGCHINSNESGVQLDNYENVMASEGVQYEERVVQAGNAEESPLIDKIASNSPEYGVRMPQGGPSLSDDEIDLIREWINDGAENDDGD